MNAFEEGLWAALHQHNGILDLAGSMPSRLPPNLLLLAVSMQAVQRDKPSRWNGKVARKGHHAGWERSDRGCVGTVVGKKQVF